MPDESNNSKNGVKKLTIDVDGSDIMTSILLKLLNEYPGLGGREILFSTLDETSGLGFFPTTGAAVTQEYEDVIGNVHQTCLYPFSVVYRSAPKSESTKIKIKEFLDSLGKWLEQQKVVLDGEEYHLDDYPTLSTTDRKIETIQRQSPGHLESAYQDGVEDWSIALSLQYENNFTK